MNCSMCISLLMASFFKLGVLRCLPMSLALRPICFLIDNLIDPTEPHHWLAHLLSNTALTSTSPYLKVPQPSHTMLASLIPSHVTLEFLERARFPIILQKNLPKIQ